MKISLSLFTATVVAVAASHSSRDDIHVLMYETDESLEHDPLSPLSFFKERSTFANLPTTVYGGGLSYEGFGDKYQTLRSILDVIDPNKLVVVADARDIALNVPENGDAATKAIDRFVETYRKLTKDDPGAVVMSAEGQCCVSAMTHAHPSEYFDPITKKRTKRACSSGKEGCYWDQNDNIYAWVDFHRQRAFEKTGIPRNIDPVGDVYLNAGLMVGYPADLMNLVDVLDINSTEDDQAVLSGLMYQFPDMIVLDYGQEMFGNNQWPRGLIDGCIYEKEKGTADPKQSFLVHTDTGAEPLIIHTPGKFYGCLDVLIEELGGTSQQRYLYESPQGNPRELKRKGIKFDTRKLNESNEGPPEAVEKCGCDCSLPLRESIEETRDNEKVENNNDEPNGDVEVDVNEGRRRRRDRRLGVRGSERRHLFGRGRGSLLQEKDRVKKDLKKLDKNVPKNFDPAQLPDAGLSVDSGVGPGVGPGVGLGPGSDKTNPSPSSNDPNGPGSKKTNGPGSKKTNGPGSEDLNGPDQRVDPDPDELLVGSVPVPVPGQVESKLATNYGYGSYGSYGIATNYGYGAYGAYGSYGVATNYGYGSYGVATNYGYGSYGQYNQYGTLLTGRNDDDCADICANHCSVAGSYGSYGSYGVSSTPDNYGQYVDTNNYGYGVASNYAPGNYGDTKNYGYGVVNNYAPGNYGQYSSYGETSTPENYGSYGSYGQYGQYSQYGVATNYGSVRRRTSNRGA